jgi:protein O-mannosyl-transferase
MSGQNAPKRQIINDRARGIVQGALIVLFVFVAYFPALRGGFIWDDDAHISNNTALRSGQGLWNIWFRPGATCQYYPLSFTLFWLGYQLWGLNPFGYHLLNVALHSLVAILLWQLLKRLRVRGAWLAGMIFALHPVCVMSVAWMTELKNTLSASLALGAGWAYVRFARLGIYGAAGSNGEGPGSGASGVDWRFGVLSLVLFLLAMFAKTAVSFLPATLLLIAWWQQERLVWRKVVPLLLMLGLIVVMSQVTFYVERVHGAAGAGFKLSWQERVLVSGQSFWFYLGKLFFPHPLTFIYRRWNTNDASGWQFVYPVTTAVLFAALWRMRRKIGKGPFVAMLHFYISTSLLILVVVLYMTRFTFVSDHWQYFGCMSVLALAAAGIARILDGLGKWNRVLKPAAIATLFLILGLLTWRQCRIYADIKTLWRDTLAKDADCWMAHNNLGCCLYDEGHIEAAMEHYRKAIQINPKYWEALENLGVALVAQGRLDEAIRNHNKAIEINPNDPDARYNLGIALAAQGRLDEAIESYHKAIQIEPNYELAFYHLGTAFAGQGRWDEAIANFNRAIQINPSRAETFCHLGAALGQLGRNREAVVQYREALRLNPNLTEGLNNLAWVLAVNPDDTVRNGSEAVRLAERACELTHYREPLFVGTLAAAYAECGRFPEAIATGEKAAQLATDAGLPNVAAKNRQLLELYRAGRPYHEPPDSEP